MKRAGSVVGYLAYLSLWCAQTTQPSNLRKHRPMKSDGLVLRMVRE